MAGLKAPWRASVAGASGEGSERGIGTFGSLRAYRNFRLYFAGQIVSFSGTFLQDTALPWLVLELTHSPFDVGALVFCRYGPFVVGGLYGGVIADRLDNRRVLIGTQVFAMVVAALLAVIAFSGRAQLWEVYGLAVCTGVQLVFENPSKWSLIYRLVGREDVRNAVALNMGLQNTARIVGPAIGGVLIAAIGIGWCFAVNAFSFLAVLAALLLMRLADLFPVERAEVHQRPLVAAREALAFVRTSVDLRVVMSISAVFGLFGFSAMRTLLSVLAGQTLHGGSELFGVLYAIYGAGAVAGALWSASAARTSRRRLFVGAVGFSAPMVCLAVLPSAGVDGLLLFLIGIGWSVWSSQAMAQVQLAAPDALRGRVISLYVYTLLATAPFGALAGGWLAGVGGTGLAFGVAGGSGLVALALSARRLRQPESKVGEAQPLAEEALG
jgi:predicted MFS family arabinose efflux permease